jgi:hypothetical protein
MTAEIIVRWVVGEWPVPAWLLEQTQWAILADDWDGAIFQNAENMMEAYWLKPGEVVTWNGVEWNFGEVREL